MNDRKHAKRKLSVRNWFGTRRIMRKFRTISILCVVLSTTGISVTYGQDSTVTIQGRITYIGADKVYGKPGSIQGLELRDTLHVFRDGQQIGRLIITAISSNSHASEVLEEESPLKINDELQIVKIVTVAVPVTEEEVGTKTSEDTTKIAQPLLTESTAVSYEHVEPKRHLSKSSGSITLRYYGIHSNKSLETYHEPGALIRWRADQIAGLPVHFSLYTRVEKEFAADLSERAGSGNRPLFRVYTARVMYGDPSSNMFWQFGRLFPREISGMGSIDGVLYGRRAGRLSYGLTAGFQPDYVDNRINTELLKIGVYGRWSNGTHGQGGYSGAVAFVGQYRKGRLDREYVTIRQQYTPIHSLRLSYVGDFTLDRKDHSSQIGFLSPSNAYLRLAWSGLRGVRGSIRYSFRRSMRLFETQSDIADSLFAYNTRQGLTANVSFRLPWQATLYVVQNYLERSGSTKPVLRTSGALSFRETRYTDVRIHTRYARAGNEFSTSHNWEIRLERQFWPNLSVRGGYDVYRYTLRGRRDTIERTNYGMDLTYVLPGNRYLSVQYDRYNDGGFQTQQVNGSVHLNF